MASSSVRNHPNFAVICSFLQRYGEQLRLPDLTIPELEEVLEETNAVGHGLKELIIALMKRIVNSIKPDRWEKHLIKLIDNYHSPVDAWELESLGFSLCKLETKLSILKYLCETQFDDNPKFKNLVNKETPEEQKIKPIGRDKLGLVYWFQKDHDCNIRIYREEQDDIDETSWQTVGKGRDDLANLIAELKVAYGAKLPLDSLESSRSATPVLTNGEANPLKPELSNGNNSVTKEGTKVMVSDADGSRPKSSESETPPKHEEEEEKNACERKLEIKEETREKIKDSNTTKENLIKSENVDVKTEPKEEDDRDIAKETVTSQEECKKDDVSDFQKGNKTDAELKSHIEDGALKAEGVKKEIDEGGSKEGKDENERQEIAESEDRKKKIKNIAKEEQSLKDLQRSEKENSEIVAENCQTDKDLPVEEEKDWKGGKKVLDNQTVEKSEEEVDGKSVIEEKPVPGEKNERDKHQKLMKEDINEGKDCVHKQSLQEEKAEGDSDISGKKSPIDKLETLDKASEEVSGGEHGGEERKDTSCEQKENGVSVVTQDDRKSLSKEEKSAAKKAEKTPAKGEAPDMGWSRRRLRVRKPPPKKEEEEEPVVQEKPKKKMKEGKKTAKTEDKVGKKKKEKKKEVEIEEEFEEEEEESEEVEEDNTSDEDFVLAELKTRYISAETDPPVLKARTARSKKSKSFSKKKEEPEELSDEPCIKCGNYNHPDQILLCDSCDAGYHTACLRPPLMYVPDGQWFCPACEHLALLKNLEATLEVVDSELKVIRQKNRKKQDKYKWLLTEVSTANILPEDSSVLITKRIERVEKPERPRHERTRPKPRKASRAFIEEPDEIEYIQRRSGRNRKQISYKFEEFDTAINSAIHEEVEEKRKAKAQEEQTGFGRSRGKDMSTIEAANWEEEENASRKKKKKLNDLDTTSSEEEEDESDEYRVNNESCSDEDFIADGDEESEVTEEDEEELMSPMSDSGSEYGSRLKKGSRKKKKVRRRNRDLGPVRRSSRNLGRERKVYQDSSSSESNEDRPRDAWRTNPIITARRQRGSDDDSAQERYERKRQRKETSSQDSGDGSEDEGKHRKRRAPSRVTKEATTKRKKKKREREASSSSEEEDEGYIQPKRKFRIDSDDSNASDEDRGDESQDEEGKDGSQDEEDRTKRKLKVRNTLRGMCSKRVDYRKMAEGSSSEEQDENEFGEEDEGSKKEDGVKSEVVKHARKDSGVIDDSRKTGNVRGGGKVEGASMLTGNVNQNNSAAANDDDSLSPISDLEDLKENGSFTSEKVQPVSGDKIDKRSTEDDDDLEGVTDIFDYLSKD